MKKSLTFWLFTTILSLSIAGCGFAPHSINSLPPQLNQLYYQTEHPYDPFESNFKKRLKTCGITLLPAPKESALIMNVSSNYNPGADNPSSSSQARTYSLGYTAKISISDFHHKVLLAPQDVSVSRSVILQPNEVLTTTPQILIVKQEMVQELIIKAFNVLSANQTFLALKNEAS